MKHVLPIIIAQQTQNVKHTHALVELFQMQAVKLVLVVPILIHSVLNATLQNARVAQQATNLLAAHVYFQTVKKVNFEIVAVLVNFVALDIIAQKAQSIKLNVAQINGQQQAQLLAHHVMQVSYLLLAQHLPMLAKIAFKNTEQLVQHAHHPHVLLVHQDII